MSSGTFFGYKCNLCGSTVDIGAVAGGNSLWCPQCNVPMVPDKNGRTSAANVHCSKCNISFGLVNSDRCLNCGGAFN